ncbi:MAG TPA: hypothetical protein VFX94_01280 [Burkholderiales bacterium]|nr:hypothetical protein [Burkholderiales bacterium]
MAKGFEGPDTEALPSRLLVGQSIQTRSRRWKKRSSMGCEKWGTSLGETWSSICVTRAGITVATYGPNWQKTYRCAATFVDRILKVAKPADMPIEQPSIEVVVNLRTSREIGVSIPQSILVRAERILE